MSTLKDVAEGIREVLRMTDDLKRTAESLKSLAIEVRDHDGRLIRLETRLDTIIDIAAAQAGRGKPRRITKKE